MAHQTGVGSVDRVNDRLADLIERMATGTRTERTETAFKAPPFEGKEQVKYLMPRFEEISMTDNWTDNAILLHVHKSLSEGTQDCGRATIVPAVFEALRTHCRTSHEKQGGNSMPSGKNIQVPCQNIIPMGGDW